MALATAAGVFDDRVGDGARQHGDAGVGDKNLRLANGKSLPPRRLVQDERCNGVCHWAGETPGATRELTVNSW